MLRWQVDAAPNLDGGRSDLPGMKQDIFDQVQRNKKAGPQQRGKAPPDCPRSDFMSPFAALAFASNEMYIKINSSEEKCQRLITVGGVNFSSLRNASVTCGPAGEWKKRIAENLSSMFFQGGWDWVRSDGEMIEVVTDVGTFELPVTEDKYASLLECWKYACGCEQANNPVMRAILFTMLAIAIGGLLYDSAKVTWQKLVGKKPSKYVECKNGHRMQEVKAARTHTCDICRVAGTTYACVKSCNYDMCKKCYKDTKKKVKAEWEAWLEKHPEDKKTSKSDKKDDDEEADKKDKKDDDEEDDKKDNKDDDEEEDKNSDDEDQKTNENKTEEDKTEEGKTDAEDKGDNESMTASAKEPDESDGGNK